MNSSLEEDSRKLLEIKRREFEILKKKKELEAVLPHLYVPMYPWQRKMHESTSRVNLLTAANQVGKSSCLIRRMIANCTDRSRWARMWGADATPRQFWYFYPDGLIIDKEVETKWIPEWLPRGHMQKDPQYGWKLSRKNGKPDMIQFNAGPALYFQSYSKKLSSIQAGSIHEVMCDEEMPMAYYDEIMFRLTATSGIFSSGFTPTLNQAFWKQAMEGKKILSQALKQTISMYECLKYEDGSPSRVMTLAKIREAESKCKNDTERRRRIYGEFITEEGRSFYGFDSEQNVVDRYNTQGWNIYAGVDYGSGGSIDSETKKGHPAAIVFVAVRPDFKKGAVIKSWRGDNEVTTAGDVFNKYVELARGMTITQAVYDHSAKDFGTIAARNGVTFIKADKSRDAGADLLNTLFKHRMLDIFNDDMENMKLAGELMHIMTSKNNGVSKDGDDLTDALRYDCLLIPWDLSAVAELVQSKLDGSEAVQVAKPLTEKELLELQINERRGIFAKDSSANDSWEELDAEFAYWNGEFGQF